MQLIAFSCHNIWPFFDRTGTVYFRDGKYLIKAPIGSGKSFLFFDGPLFGLYKHSSRPMLSMKADQWYIKILFEHDEKILLCIRDIGRTKSWNDTVKSSLFVVEDDIARVHSILTKAIEGTWNTQPINDSNTSSHWLQTDSNTVLHRDTDAIETLLETIKTEPIVSKNETDVQATLESFLPPKEVFLSTTMLLQDSNNVFELPPAERIALFKEIFWLLSIDSATDRINEEKRTVTATLKAKWDTSTIDKKLQEQLRILAESSRMLSPIINVKEEKEKRQNLIEEIEMIYEKISINEFALDTDRKDMLQSLEKTTQQQLQDAQKQFGIYEEQKKSIDTITQEIASLEKQQADIQMYLEEMHTKEQADWSKQLHEHTQKKQLLQEQFDRFSAWLAWERFPENTQNNKDINALRQTMQEHVQEGKILTEQKKFVEREITQLQESQQEEKENLEQYEKSLTQLQSDYANKKKYHCEKIDGDCPFIEHINTSFFKTLQKNIDSAKNTLLTYQSKIANNNLQGALQEKKTHLEKLEKSLATIKDLPVIRFFKEIDSAKKQYDDLVKQQQLLQREDTFLAQQLQEREDNLIKKTQYEEKRTWVVQAIIREREKLQTLQQTASTTSIADIENSIKSSQNMLSTITKITQTIDRVADLITTHKDAQREIKTLQEREKLLTDLYRIFSKEIMIKVLEDSLPFFAEYINNLLAKMVSFSVQFQPKKTANDKLELEITIRDGHGERTVRSLSGGQKAILRLARILAVAQLTHTKQLFLDETINNIDQDTIGQVTEMLKDYIKLNSTSLYLVTHASQLQEMEIWDEVIRLG